MLCVWQIPLNRERRTNPFGRGTINLALPFAAFFSFCSGTQGAQALAQVFFLGLLNDAGREAISAVVRQGNALYPPAAPRLKDITSNYSSLKGTDKWFLASILLLVTRPVLHDVTSLVRETIFQFGDSRTRF